MTIAKKMWLGFGVVILLTAVIGGMGYMGIQQGVSTMGQVIAEDIPYYQTAIAIKVEMLQHRRYEKDFFLNIGKPEKQEKYLEKFAKKSTSIRAKMDKVEKLTKTDPHFSPEIKEKASGIPVNYKKYCDGFYDVVKQVRNDSGIDPVKANKLMTPHKKYIHDLEDDIDLVAEAGTNMLKKATKETMSDGNRTKHAVMILVIMGLLLTIAIGVWVPKSINAAITRSARELFESSEEMATGADQVSSSSQSLAEGASEQAASIEETSSSLEEMSSMTKQNADNAGQADNLMKEANQVVGQANDSMSELTGSMEEISKASEETSKIIKTIDEIAFQTNLLALNAAVEAARAGEAGAGFAVVADEVRNLAMRAAEAAKNTADLIEGTVKKVGDGSDLVTKTNEAFHQVADSAEKVGALVGEIAAASNEQAQGIDQVNTAVADMDKVTQQNAANAEESASAAEEMSAQAQQMEASVAELLRMVGGARQVKDQARTASTQPTTQSRRHALAAPAKRTEKNKDNPKQVIPMGDDDFKGF